MDFQRWLAASDSASSFGLSLDRDEPLLGFQMKFELELIIEAAGSLELRISVQGSA